MLPTLQLLLMSFLLFAPPAKDGPGNARPPKEDLRAAKAMSLIVENAEFKAMPFEEFAEWLERTTKVNVVVKWKTLAKHGIDKSTPITLKCKDIPIKMLLPQVFDKLTKGKKDVHLAAKADENILIISTEEDFLSKMLTQSYDVEDLLVAVPNFPGGAPGDPTTGRNKPMSLNRNNSGNEEQPTDDRVKKLIEVITTQIKPKSWKVNGGKGTIAFHKGRLIIRNTAEVHQLIAGAIGRSPVKFPKGN